MSPLFISSLCARYLLILYGESFLYKYSCPEKVYVTPKYIFCVWALFASRVELGYNVTQKIGYIISLLTNVVVIEEYNVMIGSEELTGITE
jgi:hypothetical protein